MAWHASTHERYGVACTDCHNPHPHSCVRQIVNISHYGVEQPKRLAMSVQEPEACYKCHQRIFAMNHLPSHHPIMEGKMVCSDCHDPHGQLERKLEGGDDQPALLQVPRGESRTVRLPAPAGDGELLHLPPAARHGGQQPAEAAAGVPLLALPPRAPQARDRPRRPAPPERSRGRGYRFIPESSSRVLHQLHGVPHADPRQRRSVAVGTECVGPVPLKPELKKTNLENQPN